MAESFSGASAIPLGIRVPEAPANPLATMGELARTQNWLNEGKMFQQTFAARQKAGEIIAGSDPSDPDSMTRSLMGDPLVAPFAPQILNSMRQAESTLLDVQGKQLGQSQSVLQSVIKSLPAAMADPTQLPAILKSQLATLPKGASAAAATRSALDSMVHGLTDDLPSDPTAAAGVFQKRAMGWATSAGVTPETIRLFTGNPEMQQLGGQIQPGFGPSPIMGTGFRPAGGALPMGLTPQLAAPGLVPAGGAYGPLGSTAPTGSSSGGLAAPAARTAGDGTPLAPPGSIQEVPNLGRGTGGAVIPQDKTQKEKLQEEFSTTGMDSYRAAATTMGSLEYMNSALDNLIKGGGFNPNVPGSAMQFRTDITKGVNTIAQILGGTPPFDPTKIASIEDFNKETKRMGLMVTKSFLGGQREAAAIIQGVTSSVPGTENTYLGGKLVSASISVATQREIDLHDFQLAWQADPRNQGNLAGSVEAFKQLHPAENYSKKVLDSFGLSEGGFKTPETVKEALRLGYLTRPQASSYLQKQWPDRFKSE